MFGKKNNIVVAMTTFNPEMLRISIPQLGKLRQKFNLVIYNDNPTKTVTKSYIRKLGYRGRVYIVNSSENLGMLRARIAVLSEIIRLKLNPKWIVFNDDDDLLVNLDMPVVQKTNFAIIQNSVTVQRQLIDLLHIAEDATNYVIDNENIILNRPNIGLAGTLVRADILFGLANIISPILDKIQEIDDSLGYRPPVDAVMWSWLKMYAQHINPMAMPIYMDRINYIIINLDTAVTKYGMPVAPTSNAAHHLARAMARYDKVMQNAICAQK